MKHETWLWLWFSVGCFTYWLKRAYYLVTGPNPVAKTYLQFVQRCWIPILIRWFIDSLLFWLCFTPGVVDKGLALVHWTTYAWVVDLIRQFAPVAAMFGHTVDSVVDFALTKIPFIKDALPQMPGPLAAAAVPVAAPAK